MNDLLRRLARIAELRPFVLAYWQSGDAICLAALADCIDESRDDLAIVAQAIRKVFLGVKR